MGVRRTGRVIAFQTLFRYDFTDEPADSLLDFSWIEPERLEALKTESMDFARLLILGTLENIEEVDRAITDQLEHWDFSRLARVDLAVLRMSVFCLLFQQSIPATVTIDEAIDIAKKYGTTDSYRFVNGVLDGMRKKLTDKSPSASQPG